MLCCLQYAQKTRTPLRLSIVSFSFSRDRILPTNQMTCSTLFLFSPPSFLLLSHSQSLQDFLLLISLPRTLLLHPQLHKIKQSEGHRDTSHHICKCTIYVGGEVVPIICSLTTARLHEFARVINRHVVGKGGRSSHSS